MIQKWSNPCSFLPYNWERERGDAKPRRKVRNKNGEDTHGREHSDENVFAVSNGGVERALESPLTPTLSQIEGAFFDDRQHSPVEGTLLIFRLSHGIIEWDIIFETSMTLGNDNCFAIPGAPFDSINSKSGKSINAFAPRTPSQVKNNFVLYSRMKPPSRIKIY